MTAELIASVTIFVLAAFLGFELIRRVPTLLHTPLMSGTNAISGIIVVGAILVAGASEGALERTLAFVALVFGAVNLPSVSAWALFGAALRRHLGESAKRRLFNLAMAGLLVASLWPMIAKE